VEAVLRAASETTPLADLEDPGNWSSYEATRRRFAAAAEVLGDPEVGGHAGRELFDHYAGAEVIDLLRSLGSPGEALRVIADTATKQSTVVTMRCVEVADTSALVSAVTHSSITRDRLFCDYTGGALGAMARIFGMAAADVVELECQTRGDARCLYRVGWDPDTATDPAARVLFLQAQVASLTGRFEALEQLASELASQGDIDEALQTITRRAGVAVWAPRFVLAVRLPRESAPRVHAVGFDPEDAQRVGAEVLADHPDDGQGTRLIVEVASATHRFGRLAAFYPEGHRFLPEERRLLQAYAGHAAAALATATALADARGRAATIGALFDLATALSEVGSVGEVAERLAGALPPVVECDEVRVFVWDPDDAVLRCLGRNAAPAGTPGRADAHAPSLHLDGALVAQLTRRPVPVTFGTGSGADTLGEIGTLAGLEAGVLMPVVARRSLLGVVVAGSGRWSWTAVPSERLGERLHGVAGIAATALDNARLLDQVRHQAGHDSLTGLPNARLLDELARAALATARGHGYAVAALFVDLDLFKEVNDAFGHHAGDALLVEVGARLRSAVRAGDTVGRLGGDEFGILLPHVAGMADAEGVARRVLEELDAPATVLGGPLRVSASIGIAVSPGGRDSFERLIRRADAAMYEAKSAGRSQYRLSR
jgi:diguanylate cyclase (GGDEF)-like protein